MKTNTKRKQRARSFHNTEREAGGGAATAMQTGGGSGGCTSAACSSIVWSLIDAPHSRTKIAQQGEKEAFKRKKTPESWH